MPTILDLLALNEDLKAAASPGAKHVGEPSSSDPFGQTKGMFDKVHKAKMNYELAKQNLITSTAPTRAVLDRVAQIHQLDQQPVSMTPPNQMMQPNPADTSQGFMGNRMNDPLGTDPAMGQEVDQSQAQTQLDPASRLPQNMAQTPGQMNQNRPSKAGFSPGVSPGPSESVRPAPMGRPQPGQSKVGQKAGFPAGQNQSNPQQQQYNPVAPKPKGAKSLPGAKGPGDPKVQNKIKKAQNNSSRGSGGESTAKQINIKIHGNQDCLNGARSNMAAMTGMDSLRSCNDGKMKGAGTSDGAEKGWDSRGRSNGHKASDDYPARHNEGRFVFPDTKKEMVNPTNQAGRFVDPEKHEMSAREFSQGRRKKLAKTGAAMPGGGFPIVTKEDLGNARQAIGRAKNQSAARAHIRKRAKALGVKLPSTWKSEEMNAEMIPRGGPVATPMPRTGGPVGRAPSMPSGGSRMAMLGRGMKAKLTNLVQE